MSYERKDRRKYMDEGTKAIMQLAIDKSSKENKDYLDDKFNSLEGKVDGVVKSINELKTYGCVPCRSHEKDHKEKERRTIKIATCISAIIPTTFIVIGYIKGWILGLVK